MVVATTSLFLTTFHPKYDDFFDSGAGMATLVSADRQHARLQVDQLTPKSGVAAKAKAALKAWKADGGYLAVAEELTLGPLQKLSETMELGTRLSGFAKARSKGASMLEASQEARDLTLDFGRFGTTGQKWNYFGHAASVLRVRQEFPESQHADLLKQTARTDEMAQAAQELLTDPSLEKHQRAEMVLQIDMLVTHRNGLAPWGCCARSLYSPISQPVSKFRCCWRVPGLGFREIRHLQRGRHLQVTAAKLEQRWSD